MRRSCIRLTMMALAAVGTVGAFCLPALASSDFRVGNVFERNPVFGNANDSAVCRLFLGPRDDIPEGEFLLRIGDLNPRSGGDVEELHGSVIPDGQGSFTLTANETQAEDFYQQVLRDKLHRSSAQFDLHDLTVSVDKGPADIGDLTITCNVHLAGVLKGGTAQRTFVPPLLGVRIGSIFAARSTTGTVDLDYGGPGLFFEGIGEDVQVASVADASAGAESETPPTATVAAAGCAKPNFTPMPQFCTTPNCLVSFAGYQWWTEYDWFPSSGFWNANNRWSPANVSVDSEGLHLFVRMQNIGNGQQWTAGEAVTALNPDGSVANLGYGTYLVSARVKSAPSFDAMDPNVAFGVFTYERDRTGTSANPARELDLAEVSRWGRVDGRTCRIKPDKLCNGNSQFTLQLWDVNPPSLPNLNRYTIAPNVQEITLVMDWNGANQSILFRQYNGIFTLDNLPPKEQAAYKWQTPDSQNPYVPVDGCQQFHLNLWQGNYTDPGPEKGINPPPATPQEVVVTNFQYKPL